MLQHTATHCNTAAGIRAAQETAGGAGGRVAEATPSDRRGVEACAHCAAGAGETGQTAKGENATGATAGCPDCAIGQEAAQEVSGEGEEDFGD